MRITEKQMAAMAAGWALDEFRQEMGPHLAEFAPHYTALLGKEGIQAVVDVGIERARRYGVTNPGMLRFF
jgi:hypothetical protein